MECLFHAQHLVSAVLSDLGDNAIEVILVLCYVTWE